MPSLQKMNCPRCDEPLSQTKTELGTVLLCFSCFGHASSAKEIAHLTSPESWEKMLEHSTLAEGNAIDCPRCNTRTEIRRFHFPDGFVDLDLCRECSLLWFDKDEVEEFPFRRKKNGDLEGVLNARVVLEDGSLAAPRPLHPDAKAQLLLAQLKLDDLIKEKKRRARYWQSRRRVDTPLFIDFLSQELRGYRDMDVFDD